MPYKRRSYAKTKWLFIIFIMLIGCLFSACNNNSQDTSEIPDVAQNQTETVLNIYNWDTYIAPQILDDFSKTFGVKINYQTFDSDSVALAELRSGTASYDIVILSEFNLTSARKEKLLAPLDKRNISNLDNLAPEFVSPAYDPGNRHCVAYQWGTIGIGYNQDAIKKEVTSWNDLFDPAYAGRIAMLDDARNSLAVSLLHLGYSPNTTDQNHINEARDLLMSKAEQFITYAPDTGQEMLLAGEADIVLEWNGDILQATEGNPAIRYVIPQEGSIIWTDNMCIPKGAPNKAIAEKFINYILEPEIGATLSNFIRYGTPNEASVPFINPDDIDNTTIYPPQDVRKRLFFLANLGTETEDLYQQVWAEVITHHRALKAQNQ